MTTHFHRDYETRGTVNLKKTGVHVYSRHRDTDAWCMGYAVDDDPVKMWHMGEPCPPEFIECARNPNWLAFAHNAPFEMNIERGCMAPKHGWPEIPLERQRCTMAMALTLSLPGSLENAAASVGLSEAKDMEGHALSIRMSKPRRIEKDGSIIWWNEPEKLDRLYAYCKQDVAVERALEKRLIPLSPREQHLWMLDQQINDRGIQLDLPAIDAALDVVEETKVMLDQQMLALTGGWVAGCTKIAQLLDWLALMGCEAESMAKADVSEMLGWNYLPGDELDHQPVRTALKLRQMAAKTGLKKLDAMKISVNEDGRARGVHQFHAAATGRWGGRRIQTQNLQRPTIPQDDIDGVFKMLEG